MDDTIKAAIITGICTIIAAVLGVCFKKRSSSVKISQKSKGDNNTIIGKQENK